MDMCRCRYQRKNHSHTSIFTKTPKTLLKPIPSVNDFIYVFVSKYSKKNYIRYRQY